MASGKRVLVPSDDPVATSQLMQLSQTKATTEQYQANATSAQNRLNTEEGALQSVTNLLQRMRELAVQGNNATQTNDTRQYLATEVRQRLGELLGIANTKDGTGDYIFSGTKNATQPFTYKLGQGYVYDGSQAQRFVQIGPGRTIADGDPGSTVFQLVRNGNGTFVSIPDAANTGTGITDQGSVVGTFTPSVGAGANGYQVNFFPDPGDGHLVYQVFEASDGFTTPIDLGNPPVAGVTQADYVEGQPIHFRGAQITITGQPNVGDNFYVRSSDNQSIFETLDNLATALETPVTDPAQTAALHNSVGRALGDIDQAMNSILTVRASIGSRLNAIDGQKSVNDDQSTQTTQVISSIQDLDYAEAVSRLNMQMAGLQAAQQTFVKVQNLSLFNYLR